MKTKEQIEKYLEDCITEGDNASDFERLKILSDRVETLKWVLEE